MFLETLCTIMAAVCVTNFNKKLQKVEKKLEKYRKIVYNSKHFSRTRFCLRGDAEKVLYGTQLRGFGSLEDGGFATFLPQVTQRQKRS